MRPLPHSVTHFTTESTEHTEKIAPGLVWPSLESPLGGKFVLHKELIKGL